MSERSSIFDMIGPVMIGPSSSHTAGVVRIGRVAVKILGQSPEKANITFYNSFAQTYEGHGSDRAIIAGLLDFATDDIRIKNSFDYAQENNLSYTFKAIGNASLFHPNTIKLELSAGEKHIELIGESRGGGIIHIASYNGFKADISGASHTLMILADDAKGMVAFIATVLAHDDCNIATMSVSRKGKNDLACHFYEIDSPLNPTTIAYLKSLKAIHEVINVDLTGI
ncbi:MAG: L-serine ammonia-lyase, iron-sulfur-dependent subunit beta [Thermonemataceae bacterium]|nr:L-serine ammonia-lyase, iron-sulfur-dependent subunit beta [Thermonemataceae bacterium]